MTTPWRNRVYRSFFASSSRSEARTEYTFDGYFDQVVPIRYFSFRPWPASWWRSPSQASATSALPVAAACVHCAPAATYLTDLGSIPSSTSIGSTITCQPVEPRAIVFPFRSFGDLIGLLSGSAKSKTCPEITSQTDLTAMPLSIEAVRTPGDG